MKKIIQVRIHEETHKRLRMHCLSIGISVQKLVSNYVEVVAMLPPGDSEQRKKLCADICVNLAREQQGEYEHATEEKPVDS